VVSFGIQKDAPSIYRLIQKFRLYSMNVFIAAFVFDPLRVPSLSGVIAYADRSLLWSGITLLTLTVGILCLWIYRSKTRTTGVPSAEELRDRLAQVVAMWAMVAIVVLGITILAIAGYHAAATKTPESSREFIDMAKYIFAGCRPGRCGMGRHSDPRRASARFPQAHQRRMPRLPWNG
jgi:hypothetical protein